MTQHFSINVIQDFGGWIMFIIGIGMLSYSTFNYITGIYIPMYYLVISTISVSIMIAGVIIQDKITKQFNRNVSN